MGAVVVGSGDAEDLVHFELERLRSLNIFSDLAASLPEDSGVRNAVEALAASFMGQLVVALLAYLGMALSFRILAGADVETMKGLNFFLYLYLLGTAIYFGRFGARAWIASLAMLLVAILAFAVQLTGFRPSIFYLLTHPLVTLLAISNLSSIYEHAARKGITAATTQRHLLDLQQRQHSSGQNDEDIMRRLKEAEVRSVEIKTRFSDLLNNLRDLGGAYKESDIYSTLFRLLNRGVGAETAEIWFVSEDKTNLEVIEARVVGGGQMLVTEFHATTPHDGSSLISHCAKKAQALLPETISRDGSLKSIQARGEAPTMFCFPILIDGQAKAVVNVSKGPRTLDAQQCALLNTISQITSKAFESAHTFQLSESERKAAVHLSEEERKERIHTRETLERFVSKNVVEDIMANPNLSQNMEVTILLADLRGFTTLSERLAPEVVVEMLNDYFGSLTPLIFDFGGTLDKYIGDMVMALFGPPRPSGKDAERAVRCAIEMHRAFNRKFCTKWEPKVKSKLEMGISLNTGKATVGLLGSERLVNYTAIGDAVNTASRLEDSTPGGMILMTEATCRKVHSIIEVRKVGAKAFKGKTEKTNIFRVMGLKAQAEKTTPRPTKRPRPPATQVAKPPRSQAQVKPAPSPPPSAPPCPLCQAAIPVGSTNCPTCGMKL
jgi:class 3 adenylate cyclase